MSDTLPDIGDARRLAVQRIIDVLRYKLEGEVSAAVSRLDVTPPPPMPVPERCAYFATDPDHVESQPIPHHVWAYVVPAATRTILRNNSEGMGAYKAQTEQDFDIELYFRYALGQEQCTTQGGNAIAPAVIMRQRAEAYLSGIIQAIYKYACNSSAIHDIVLVNDIASPIYNEQREAILGVAWCTFRVTQFVMTPTKQPFTPPDEA